MDELIGKTYDGLRIKQQLGVGGVAVVYLAEDEHTGKRYALKIVQPRHMKNGRVLARFQLEGPIYEKLRDCYHVVPVHGTMHVEGLPTLVMEYVSGPTLERLMEERGRMPIPDALALLNQVVFAVTMAHQRGVVHRDLKPSNVLLEYDPTSEAEFVARLSDFGIARDTEAQRMTSYGKPIGTLVYAPPEQLLGRIRDICPASDVYSLGVTLFEMTLGQLPFNEPTGNEYKLIKMVKDEPPPHPRSLDPAYPDTLARVILRCLEKDPAARYADASALLAQLDGIYTGRSVVPELPQARAWLIDLSYPQSPRSFDVPAEGLAIGRDPTNRVCLNDPHVSSRHARLYWDASGRCVLEDVGSANGTYFMATAERVRAAYLESGTTFQLGKSGQLCFLYWERRSR